MKKIVLFFAPLFIGFGTYAQYITLDPSFADVDGDPSVLTSVEIELSNSGTHQTMTWKRMVNEIPAEWTSSVCDFNLCWAPAADSPGYYFDVAADTTGLVYVKFDARNYHDGAFDPYPGCGQVEVMFYSVTDSLDYHAYGVFHAKLGVDNCPTAIFSSPNMDNSFLVYPNPAKNSVNMLASFSAHIQRVEVVNIVGKTVKNITWNATDGIMAVDMTDIPGGIYFVRFINNQEKVVATDKFSLMK